MKVVNMPLIQTTSVHVRQIDAMMKERWLILLRTTKFGNFLIDALIVYNTVVIKSIIEVFM